MARCTEIPEKLQNAFAAMAGSGPAYIYQVRYDYFCHMFMMMIGLIACAAPANQVRIFQNSEEVMTMMTIMTMMTVMMVMMVMMVMVITMVVMVIYTFITR